ncbi:hypothetical protein P5705_00795 [Pseudomonas entomophila]|uniref:hypothetical protein n=1 Tax=Pseudomonas entomophila TaxID=312306 RepID=UPI0024076F6B|nr:hypothetical protein [Pseudomonas entomophila]MDF9616171.1 hypothetical protein [Pseudomonas entomophila]
MANTQVFTLGVTSSQALGRSSDTLRAQLERLRRQADGTRLGRLIGEVIRLGLELDKTGAAERRLGIDQALAHEEQIDRLRLEGDEVERLRRLYLSLGRKPLELRAVAVVASTAAATTSGPSLEQRKAALLEGVSPTPNPARGDSPEARGAEQGRVPLESANAGLAVLKAGVIGAGATVGTVAVAAAGRSAYRGYQSQTPERRSEITSGLRKNAGKAGAKAITNLGLAALKETGEDKAEAVGAALGGVLGNLGAELLGGLTKNKQIQAYGGEIGEMIGEGIGGFFGKTVYGWFSDTPAANEASGKSTDPSRRDASEQGKVVASEDAGPQPGDTPGKAPDTPSAEPQGPAKGGRELVNGALYAGAALVGGAALTVGGKAMYNRLTPERRNEITGGVRENAGKAGAKAVANLGLATLKESGEDKAEAVGSALGGALGNMGAELLGGWTKNKQIQKYGGEIGELIGEGVGGFLGKAYYGLFSDTPAANDASAKDAKAPASSSGRPATRLARQDDEEEIEEEEEEEEIGEAEEEAALFEAQEQASASSVATPSQSSSTSVGLAGTAFGGLLGKAGSSGAEASVARRVFKRIPGAAMLDTGLQLAETYNSDATADQKLEGYGTAVGGLGGGLAGAAAGAAIGSVVPVIGTAIGGLIGGVLGSMGGESIGGWLGKALGSGKDEPPGKPGLGEAARAVDSAPVQPAVMPTSPASAATPPAPINQQFTFTANMPVTFSNSLDDPSVLQQLEAIARRQLEELMRQARSVQLADTPHIAL